MVNFGIATINYGRPRVFELFCASIKRLRYDLNTYIPVACVSEESDKPMCNKYYIEHFTEPNKPISRKWNRAFGYFRSIGVDYVIILGSDDIISTELLRAIVEQMERGVSLIGINTIYFYSAEGMYKGKLARLQSKQILGVAKAIHHSALDPIKWHVSPIDKNWGIDAIMSNAIKPHVTTKAVVDGVCVDVKTSLNINHWSALGKTRPMVDPEIFYGILGEEEKQLLAKI
jgi:hypothetical protein